jgi:quercetin dioxygenase-like cupin family protein
MLKEVKKVRELIDYQKGSVVSRILLDRKSGTVTLFAFDKGEGLSEHTAPFDAMVYVLEGKLDIKISDKDYELTEGEMIVMPSNEPHSLTPREKSKMLLVMLKSEIDNE